MTIEHDRGARPVVRARVDRATACYYPGSHRVVLVADKGDIDAAQAALTELRDHLASMAKEAPA
ncbi:hypothetical protein SEA_KNOCKER_70 [Mycobacterium phage Knocker]|nr:hypothetical protein SEA_KNOCKER_70 [Mycobacterium phage Knocker]